MKKYPSLSRALFSLSELQTDKQKIKLFENSTDIIADLLDNELTVSQYETNFKIKLPPFLEISRKVTKVKKDK